MPISSFTLHHYWRPVLNNTDKPYCFPEATSRFLKDRYSRAAVYRWQIQGLEPGTQVPVYIGETENLSRRLQRVRTPSKGKAGATNKRLKAVFEEAIKKGGQVYLDLLEVDAFELNGILFQSSDVVDGFKRRALENLMLCIARASGHPILNKFVDPVEKTAREIAQAGLSARQLQDLLKKALQAKDRRDSSV